jgi:hypothetical protein
MKRKSWPKGKNGWCFATINGRLGEIFFETAGGLSSIFAHCYVDRKEFKTKQEQEMIDTDIKRNRFTYRNKKYTQKIKGA